MLQRHCARQLAVLAALAPAMLLGSRPAMADVKLPPVISSHMVLQRDMPVPIWGTAAPSEEVTVTFREQKQSATADAQGKWQVKLAALKAGGPDTLVVSGKNTLTLDDVLVGEVWVGSGQSNMAMNSGSYVKDDPVLEKELAGAPYPKLRLKSGPNGVWKECTAQDAAGFSSLLFAFGVPLQKALDVPVGLIVGAVGGTPSGYWLSQEAYDADDACRDVVAKYSQTYSFEDAQKKYEQDLARWKEADDKAKADGTAKEGKKGPGKPQPPLKAGESRGKIGNLYEAHMRANLPFAIRGVLWDQGESGTAIEGLDQYTLMGALIRGWRKEWGQGDFPFLFVQKPSGGGCAADPQDPVTNRAQPFQPLAKVPNDGFSREMHIRIMNYPATFMVTSTDLGSGIHPLNKSGYGARAARVALGGVYGRNVEYYGPVYDSHTIDGGKVRVKFKHVGSGLTFKHGDKLQGFAVAGDDKQFQWAKAEIDGNDVVLSCEQVPQPKDIRYAWSQNHPWANLFNNDDLPAISFRTDK
jgi:sialate O-acetylesterase